MSSPHDHWKRHRSYSGGDGSARIDRYDVAALLDQLGPYNETQVDKPMPIEAGSGDHAADGIATKETATTITGERSGDQEADTIGNLRTSVMSNPVVSTLHCRLRELGCVVVISFRHQSFGLVLEEYRNAKNGWAHLHQGMRKRAEALRPH